MVAEVLEAMKAQTKEPAEAVEATVEAQEGLQVALYL